MSGLNSFDDLYKLGWRRRQVGRRKTYSRPPPSNGVVRQSRDLSEEERVAFGHILFPGRRSHGQSLPVAESVSPPQYLPPSPSPTSSSTPPDTAPSPSGSTALESGGTVSGTQKAQGTEVYVKNQTRGP